MTRIILKNNINNVQLSVLMELFNSWNINAEISDEKATKQKSFSQLFSKTRGMWQNYDINANQLRNTAWGIQE
jgi:hypothetical protein